MAQRVSQGEQVAADQMRRERDGTAGLVQCEGCPPGVFVADDPSAGADRGLCSRHRRQHPDAWMTYTPDLYEGYDAAGRL